MKKITLAAVLFTGILAFSSCGGDNANQTSANGAATEEKSASDAAADDAKGKGKFTNVELTTPLDQSKVTAGKAIYDLKCGSCHRLNGEKLVGPGWKGVTSRRKPEWIMNFATNVDEMLNTDPAAMALLEQCLVRMPNQNLTDDDARNILEFMRSNDGEK